MGIDLNMDVGEGMNNEEQLFPYISSCNIACGGHAGDAQSMDHIIKLAKRYNIRVGAHPSFDDKLNFGRVVLDLTRQELNDSIHKQLVLFRTIAESNRVQINHIKPHGALYNLAAKDAETAETILEVTTQLNIRSLYAPFGSVIAELAKRYNVNVIYEAFGDRNYNEDLSLVSRKNSNAMILDPKLMIGHVLDMIQNSEVETISGKSVFIKAETICLHGDSENATQLIRELNNALISKGIEIT